MAQAKEIRRRLKSVKNTKQIMKAMEMISAVKMQRAISSNLASRSYSGSAEEMLIHLFENIKLNDHPYLIEKGGNKRLIIVVTSDRGLCGGLNAKIIKKAVEEIHGKEEESAFLTVGKKGRDFLKRYDYSIIADFTKFGDSPSESKIRSIIKIITEDFLKGVYDKVSIIYSHFESPLVQNPKIIKLLPFEKPENTKEYDEKIIFEPDRDSLLDNLIPRALEIKVRQALLESIASEHSARMVAMKNANENAGELVDDLTLTLNQTRQAGITQELAEISAGKMTLEE